MYSLQIRKVLRCLQLRLLKKIRKTFNNCTVRMSSWFLELTNHLVDSLKIFFNIHSLTKCLHVVLFLFSFWVQLMQHVYFPSILGILNTKIFTVKQKIIFVFLMKTWKTTFNAEIFSAVPICLKATKVQDSFEFSSTWDV